MAVEHDQTGDVSCTKEFAIMRDVICQYHPAFKTNIRLREFGMDAPARFNIPRLVEESLAAVGGYDFIDGDHSDFSDGTESKTGSIRRNPTSSGACNTHSGQLTSVVSAAGIPKLGALRCVIYNPHKDNLRYYFLPKWFWQEHVSIHPTSNIGKIEFTYNRALDSISKLDGLILPTFAELASARA